MPQNSNALSSFTEWSARLAAFPARAERYLITLSKEGLEVGLYQLVSSDLQDVHDRDELYVIVEGEGIFRLGEREIAYKAGDLLFVPAHMHHRFETFGERLTAWAIFLGQHQS
jgi:mannose-6-phosphate isomerase-like protein (cupin superfamily)